MVHLSPTAAEEVKRLLEREQDKEKGLRLGVKGGGCSGLSYDMSFDRPREGDKLFEEHGVRLIVDPKSLLYLSGLTLDFADTLQGRGFKFLNPNASRTCGCGESFSA